MERKSRARTESAAFVAIVAVALVLVNILAIRVFARLDLTKRRLFTLSEGTERIVRSLRDQLTITVYFTPNQPPPLNDHERYLRDQLDEYRSLGRGHVVIRYVTPDNEQRQRDAEAAGCVKGTMQTAENDQATRRDGYRCVTFEYLGRRDKIEFLQGIEGLEYEISSIIKNISAPEGQRERTIGFLTGHGETTPEEGMQYLPQLMEQARVTYRTRSINLNNGETEVPSDIKGLIIVNPTREIPERELRRLDAYLMRGGSIAVFAGGVTFPSAEARGSSGTAAEHHLNDWLNGYGLRLESNVALDVRATDGFMREGRGVARVPMVTWPLIAAVESTPSQRTLEREGGLDPSFPAVFRLAEIVMPYTSTIAIDRGQVSRGGGAVTVFGRTGPRSILRTSDFDIQTIEILRQGRQLFQNPPNHGPYVVAAALQGRFRSAFAGRAPGAAAGADGGAPAGGDAGLGASVGDVPERATSSARLMVLSSGNMFALDALRDLAQLSGGRLPSNLTLLFNTFDWLSQDTDLLAVRAKDVSDPSIRPDVSDSAKTFFKWGTIVVLPLAIGILGVAVLSARRRQRKGYAREFGVGGSSGGKAA